MPEPEVKAPVTTPAVDAPAPVTRAEFEALQAALAAQAKQFNGISAALRFVSKGGPAAAGVDAPPTDEQRDTLKTLRDEIERDRKAARDEKIDAALDSFAAQNGVSNKRLFKLLVRDQHMSDNAKEKITVSNGEVVYDDGLGTLHPFAELGKRILSSQDGSTFLPPTETPGAVGQRTQQGVIMPAGSKLPGQWSAEDIAKDPAGAARVLGAHLATMQRG